MSTNRPARTPLGKTMSLERKLPLVMTALLAVVLTLSLSLTYGALTQSEERGARDRMSRAARQVASTVEDAMAERRVQLRQLSRDPTVGRALSRPAQLPRDTVVLGAALAVLARGRPLSDTGLATALWDADGTPVAHLGPEPDAVDRATAPRTDSVAFGPMYASRGGVRFWSVAPVREGGRRVGYIALERRVSGPRDAPETLRALIGEDVTLYMRNAAGGFWASAPGEPASPPAALDSGGGGLIGTRAEGRTIIAEAPIQGTPWVAVLESPLRVVRARARNTLASLALLSLALIVVGAALSWVISRRITAPLASLTAGAEAVARGEYEGRLDRGGGDEIGRLFTSFNQMAAEVAASRRELERRVEDAQAAAQALESANARLQHAIGEAERARAEAEQANRAKSDFLAVMSHELRTPLNAIGGYAQLVELGLYGPVTDEQREALTRIARSQAHLLRLINDVLNFAKIDAGQVDYRIADVPLDDALTELEPLVAPQLGAKGLTFTYRSCDPRLTVRADREKLHQVVLNLLTNAIKFTNQGGHVAVDCDSDARLVRLRVRDTGVGIPPERLPRIFDPFVQGDRALNRPHEGVGLGLAISRDLARGMGGDVTAESVVGKGSVFTLTLPRRSEEEMGAATRGGRERQAV